MNQNVDAAFREILAGISGDQLPLPAEINRLRALLGGIVRAYDKAKDDPAARIPTVLMVAIEAARA